MNKGKVMQIQVFAFDTGEFLETPSSSFSWYREEDTLTNGVFPYTCKCLTKE